MDGNKIIIPAQKEFIVLFNNGEGNVIYEFETVEEAFLKKVELSRAMTGVSVYKRTELSIQMS